MELGTVVLRLSGDRCDLAAVDFLARLSLQVRRAGFSMEVTEVADDLVGLLHLIGLSIEVLREPEDGEQTSFDERVVGDDRTV